MDMLTNVSVTPPGISFLKLIGSAGKNSYLSKECHDDNSNSLIVPLVYEETSVKQEKPTSVSHVQSLISTPKISATEFPPTQRQCSFAQSVINGNCTILICSIIFHLNRVTQC